MNRANDVYAVIVSKQSAGIAVVPPGFYTPAEECEESFSEGAQPPILGRI
jgi:hypothetical protein